MSQSGKFPEPTGALPVGTAPAPAPVLPTMIRLPSGEALTSDEATVLGLGRGLSVIVLVGPVACGKTTLIASIYERLLDGPFGNMFFAGSETLLGFELLCHDGRAASLRAVPETVHTPFGDHRFQHLTLAMEGDPQQRREILLADISGEEFEAACESHEEAQRLHVVKRADHVGVLMDGERLLVPAQRHAVRSETELLISSLLQAGVLSRASRVYLIVSKSDRLDDVSDPATESFIDSTMSELQDRYGDAVGLLEAHRVAARDTRGTLPFASGAEQLVARWLEPNTSRWRPARPPIKRQREYREIDRFVYRYSASTGLVE